MFFLSLETSTVAFRTVLDELLCFFFALNLISFRYFFRNLSFLLSCLLLGENLPRKFPRNSREIGRFPREFVSSNPAKFHFFSRELSEALNKGWASEPYKLCKPGFLAPIKADPQTMCKHSCKIIRWTIAFFLNKSELVKRP